MKTDLLFESCPFITSTNVTLSQIGIADCDALWNLMRDESLFVYEEDVPILSQYQAEARLEHWALMFRQKRSIALGVYANTDLTRLIGWIEIGGVDPDLNLLSLRFLFSRKAQNIGCAAEALRALCRYLFELVRVNRVQTVCHAANRAKLSALSRAGFVQEGILRACTSWERFGIVDISVCAMLASDYARLKEQFAEDEKDGTEI